MTNEIKPWNKLGTSPAPWTANDKDAREYGYVRNKNGIVANSWDEKNHRRFADATAIAELPNLYETLRECEAKLDACDPYCDLLERVRTALRKAAGEEVAK